MLLAGPLVCLALVVAVLLGSRGPGPLDQVDPANQRNGLLLAGPTLEPTPQPPLPGLVPGQGSDARPTVLLFVRDAPRGDVLSRWRDMLPTDTHLVLVLQEPDTGIDSDQPSDSVAQSVEDVAAAAAAAGADTVTDPDGRLAEAVRLPEPQDGGPGVGYAVVDADGVVRYSTLDPAWYDNAFEVDTIVGAVA